LSGDQTLEVVVNFSVKKIFILLLAFGTFACSNDKSPKLVPVYPPAPGEKISDVGEVNKESFRPALDILFIIDDSGSMGEHQQNLSANIGLFTDAIVKTKFLDYHIGVITSTAQAGMSFGFGGNGSANCCGKLAGSPNYVERSTPNGIQALQANLLVGTNGDSREAFFDPLVMALSPQLAVGANKGFLRKDAYLALVFITDTDDQSQANDVKSTLDFLKAIKGSLDKVLVGAAYIPDSELGSAADGKCPGESEVQSLDNLPQFFKQTNALTFSLCAPDYGAKLVDLGELIATKAKTMYLQKIPKRGTIKITIGTDVLPNDSKTGWTYNPALNGIEFGPNIDWDKYPDNTYPVVDFETIPVSNLFTK
jgi:hypothetical protein